MQIHRRLVSTTECFFLCALATAIGPIHTYARGQSVPTHEKRSFLEQKGCPLHAIAQKGSSLKLRNSSDKEIVNWGEFCLARHNRGYRVLALYTIKDPKVKPGDFTVDEFGLDATPLNTCRSAGGLIAISEVVYLDGTRWRSQWNTGPALAIKQDSK